LVNKSFLSLSQYINPPEYRLLDTTRAYSSQAQGPTEEREHAKEEHARYFLNLLEQKDWDTYRPTTERIKIQGYIEEIRIALDWTFGAKPDLGVKLALAAERLWLEYGSLAQGIEYLRTALAHVDTTPDANPLLRARLLASVASAQAFVPGPLDMAIFEEAWQAARSAQDVFLELRTLYTLFQVASMARHPTIRYVEEFGVTAARYQDAVAKQILVRQVSDLALAAQKFEAFLADCAYVPREYNLYFGGGINSTTARFYWRTQNTS
jgi:hypothetical protein